jgi:Fe-S cluster assembly protein SufD
MNLAAQKKDTVPGTDLVELVREAGDSMVNKGPEWLKRVREQGADQLARLPLPARKQEAWRYTSIGFLDLERYAAVTDGPNRALGLGDIEELLTDQDADRLVFVDGFFAPDLSHIDAATLAPGSGVTLSTLSGQITDVPEVLRGRFDAIAEESHVFAALNRALMADGALVHVAAGSRPTRPLELLHVAVGRDEAGICHPRHLLVIDDGARAHVTERYVSLGDSVYFNNALVEVSCGEGSELVHERVQEESGLAQHLTDLHVRLAADSVYRHVFAAIGGSWSRTDIRVSFAGERATAEFDGLLLARDGQLNDVHLDVRHNVPACTSRENFKGILDGKGKLVFDGRILVARDAQQTDAQLSNHNLMLSRSAEVDTKPQLEIYADDVKCSHGTTVGELDQDMLFYLRSRGVPAAQARQMLCQGFAEEIISRFGDESLQSRVSRLLHRRLSTSA